jgi:thioredoxin:protein disulfide reductase
MKFLHNPIRFIMLFVISFSVFSIEIPGVEKPALGFEDDFVEVDQAFIVSGNKIDNSIFVRFEIKEGYYLYLKRFGFAANTSSSPVLIPNGLDYEDEYFGVVKIFRKHVEIEIPNIDLTEPLVLRVGFQGCADKGLCYTPTKRYLTFTTGQDVGVFSKKHEQSKLLKKLDIKPHQDTSENQINVEQVSNNQSPKEQVAKKQTANYQGLSETDNNGYQTEESKLQGLLLNGSTIAVIFAFVIAGIGLAFTPCVFPMIPILSSIISGQGPDITKKKAFVLSLIYVQAMALTYALLGVLVALAGSSLAVKLQNPWIISAVALLFVALSLSMFGLYELQLPSGLQARLNKVNQNQQGGTYIGVAIMGVLSTLIVSPCTTAPLTGAMLYIASTEDLWFGGLALYALGVGMGIPLLLVGMSAGKLLPKAGNWMNQIKVFFGVSLIGMALYIARFLIQDQVYLILWAILLVTYSIQLGVFERTNNGWEVVKKGISFVIFIAGIIYLLGAAMGNSNPFKPLQIQFSGGQAQTAKLAFREVSSLEEIQQQIILANQQDKTVMLDFVADWCTACYEFADYTFTDANVKKALANSVLLKFDSTFESDEVNLVMAHYKILGLPSILFIGKQGMEVANSRVTGFLNAERFTQHVNVVFEQ